MSFRPFRWCGFASLEEHRSFNRTRASPDRRPGMRPLQIETPLAFPDTPQAPFRDDEALPQDCVATDSDFALHHRAQATLVCLIAWLASFSRLFLKAFMHEPAFPIRAASARVQPMRGSSLACQAVAARQEEGRPCRRRSAQGRR